jgi:hypothetical protein
MRVILLTAAALALAGCEVPPSASQAYGACEAEGMRAYASAPDAHRMVQAYIEPCMEGKGFKEDSAPACLRSITATGDRDHSCYVR